MPTTLSTDRLTLRTYADADADALFDLHSRVEVQRWLGDGKPMTDVAQARASIVRRREVPYPEPMGIWAIDFEGRLVGTLLLKPIPISGSAQAADSGNPKFALDSPEIEIGWHLHPDVWGEGIATEAATRVLAHASALPRIVAVTYPQNFPSQRVTARLGMRDEGMTDRYYNLTMRLFVLER